MKGVISLVLIVFACSFVFAGASSSVRHNFYIAETDNSSNLVEPVASGLTNGHGISLVILLIVAVILVAYYIFRPKKKTGHRRKMATRKTKK